MFFAILVIYAIVGYAMNDNGFGIGTYQFWCLLALMWALEKCVEVRTVEQLKKEEK